MTSNSGASELGELITREVVLQLVKDHPWSTVRELSGFYTGSTVEIPESVFNLVRSRIASMSSGSAKVPGLVSQNKRWHYELEKPTKRTESFKPLEMTPLTIPVKAAPVADKIGYAPGAGGVSVTFTGEIAIPTHYEHNNLWSNLSISVPIVLPAGLVWVGDKSDPNGSWTAVPLGKNASVCICNEVPDVPAYFYHERYVKVVERGADGVHHCTIYKLTGDFNLYVER